MKLLANSGEVVAKKYGPIIRSATATGPIISELRQDPQSPIASLCTEAGRVQAERVINTFFSGDSSTGMFKQRPVDASAQKALLATLDRKLPCKANWLELCHQSALSIS